MICSHRDGFQELLFWNHLCPCSLAVAACSSLGDNVSDDVGDDAGDEDEEDDDGLNVHGACTQCTSHIFVRHTVRI